MRCLLIGNYGVGNLGDEALREYFLHAYPEMEWTVLTQKPSALNERYHLPTGIRSILRTPWMRTLKALRASDAVVFGGGSLFTDVESAYACFVWFIHALAARLYGKPVFLAFQGMGPYKTWMGERLARWAAAHSVFISVRDEASAKRVASWNVSTKIVQTFDPVFSLMQSKKREISTQNVFIIIPRHNSGDLLKNASLEALSRTSNISEVHILSMQPDHMSEQRAIERLHTSLPLAAKIIPVRTVDELMNSVCGARYMVSQRFHGALAGLAADIPLTVVAQGEGDKLWELKKFTGDSAQSTSSLSEAIMIGEIALRVELMHWNKQ
jgi:polysaccharide pyruvyl transferase CsaB